MHSGRQRSTDLILKSAFELDMRREGRGINSYDALPTLLTICEEREVELFSSFQSQQYHGKILPLRDAG